jgi:hypothetical protein
MGGIPMTRTDGKPTKATMLDAISIMSGAIGGAARATGGDPTIFQRENAPAKSAMTTAKQNLSGGKDPGSVGRKSTILTGAQGLPRLGGIQPLEDHKKKRLGQ